MKRCVYSKTVCCLLVLILLMQCLEVPVFANDDGTDISCTVNPDGRHTPVPYNIEPTCTEPGYKGGAYCSACNRELITPGMIGPLNHKKSYGQITLFMNSFPLILQYQNNKED